MNQRVRNQLRCRRSLQRCGFERQPSSGPGCVLLAGPRTSCVHPHPARKRAGASGSSRSAALKTRTMVSAAEYQRVGSWRSAPHAGRRAVDLKRARSPPPGSARNTERILIELGSDDPD